MHIIFNLYCEVNTEQKLTYIHTLTNTAIIDFSSLGVTMTNTTMYIKIRNRLN